ncbi:MAG: hypothetical protein WA322_22570 [Pseudolabrys sp.]
MEHKNETAQARALRLLEAIYERTVITGNPVHATKLAVTIGSTEEEALAAWRYLKERNLIKAYNIAGAARVNANGIDTIENARRHPDNPPPGFGSITYNNITIHHMAGGGIQQAGANSIQHQTIYNSQDLDDLRQAIGILEHHIDELNLDAATKRKALAQVVTLKAQLSDEPNPTIIREAGRSLRNITEGTIGGLLSAAAIDHWQLVHDVLTRLFPF